MYILRENGFIEPTKQRVLSFIRTQNLMRIPKEELGNRGVEEIWKNDIAWKRKNLLEDDYISSPRKGHWRLTDKADAYVTKKKSVWTDLESMSERSELLSIANYFSDELLNWKLRIARNEDLSVGPRER